MCREANEMATIKSFKSIRPVKGYEEKIAALPYDVYNREEAYEIVKKEPLSFLRIDRAETQFDKDVDTYDARVYQKAHDSLWKMVEDKYFEMEESNCYYIYELTMNHRAQTGIVACASVDDYLNGVIKKHENTRQDKEEDRIQHVNVCQAQTGPIFLAFRAKKVLHDIIDSVKEEVPIYDFVATDGVNHRVWIVSDVDRIKNIEEQFNLINDIYIADGHHRAASAVKVALKKRMEMPEYNKNAEFNFFLSVLFPDDQLMIMDYNRAVKDLNGHTKEQFLAQISINFEVEFLGETYCKPEYKSSFGMYLDNGWYRLLAKADIIKNHPVESLDVSLLQNYILKPILGIENPKTDKRIDFIGGIRGFSELERRVSTDCAVAFSMYPTSIEELFAVSDAQLLMPPKSTWFEPKLRSGLFIHSIKDE